ncbi:MAG: 16S rRNA processing protein RimM [Bacteroidales bacterium]|nr:16S rRNA processing protein RimM [Bacteroidales bacterium]
MISSDKLTALGTFAKPHGIKGEIAAALDMETAEILLAPGHLFVELDGLMVPFTILGVRPKSSETVLLTLKGIADEKQAGALTGKDIMLETELVPEDADAAEGFYLDDLIGFAVVADGTEVGTIEDYDDSTVNVLFKVKTADGREILIPADDNLIEDIDTDNKIIEMSLPEGLLELD